MKLLAIAAFLGLTASAAIAAPLEERAPGPSGQVLSPNGGTVIQSTDLGNGGIWLEYKGVKDYTLNGGSTYALTYGVSASLVPVNGGGSYLLSNGEAINPKTGKATAFLKTPKGACGDYNLVLVETQYYKGQLIQFQSAAPRLHINCAPTP